MIVQIPLWYCITDRARIELWNFQRQTYGLNLEIPSYPHVFEELGQIIREMSKKPWHPAGRGYKP